MKYKKILLFIMLMLLPITIYAYDGKLIASGKNIGIEVNSDGALIVGFYKDDARRVGLRIGDRIKKVNNKNVNTSYDIESYIKEGENEFQVVRNNKIYNYKLNIDREDNTLKTGIYIKNKITGIGTLTYIDPVSKKFAALGHEIDDANTMSLFKISDGIIFNSSVVGINKSSRGYAGEKKTVFDKNNIYGNIGKNKATGIYGNYLKELEGEEVEIGDAIVGDATIKTQIDDNIKDYKINILSINKSGTRNILFEITSDELKSKTGGIVQGMSGSPILQNGKIVGAVTHVIVDNPNKGYGIDIKKMIEN